MPDAIEMFRSLLRAQTDGGRGIAPAAVPFARALAEQLTIDAREGEDLAGALRRACAERDDLASRLGSALAQLRAARAPSAPQPPGTSRTGPAKRAAAARGAAGPRLSPEAWFDAAGLHGPARAMLARFRKTLATEARTDPAAFVSRVARTRLARQAADARQRSQLRADCAAGVAVLGCGVAEWYRELARRGFGPATLGEGTIGPAYLPDRLPALPAAVEPAPARKRGAP